ncbi:DUF262 domain-containing protein [Shewanella algae]|uniref:DUF262 domain-containing protein n=1 Tax=Shewanella algae TaxID=38313 RepID=UPI001BEEF463|nr:DUF262 domain-containing protein [Shewanella algae]BCV57747.1 hypothetical protein TUM17384_16920 [Shewanella algae]
MINPINFIDVESRPIKWLVDGLKGDTIVVDNSFQRRYVWVLKDKVSLIETILLGYPIPEVYLWQNETDPETGDTIFSIVDGQQRLGAVQGFINDEFKLSKTGLENKDSEYSGKKFSDLSSDLKSKLWKYPFSIRFIDESLSKENIVNLFLRLNRTNATLNPQELRNAEFSGLFIKLADEISKDNFWNDFSIFNSADIRRMNDIQFISTLLIFLRLGIEEETTQSSINRVYDLYNENYPEADEDREIILSVLSLLRDVVNEKTSILDVVKKKTHFYTLFVYSYYLIRSNKKEQVEEISKKLEDWYFHYLNESTFENDKLRALLEEYRVLSQEGVQKKVNRQRRFEIIKEYVGI